MYCCLTSQALVTSNPAFFENVVAGVQLNDALSGEAFSRAYGAGKQHDDGYLHSIYTNRTGDQVLDLVRHPGNPPHVFNEIRVFRGTPSVTGKLPAISIKTFVTRKRIRLGITPTQLLRKLGP